MKFTTLFTIITSLYLSGSAWAQNVPGTDLVEKTFALKIVKKDKPSLSLAELVDGIEVMNAYVGSYPPRFKDEAERQVIYEKWLGLISEAEAYAATNKNEENAFYVRSELYRQGHNMDVIGSSKKAMENLDACFKLYEKSVACHFSANYFYLSIDPQYHHKGEKSLAFLREHFNPELHPEVEAGYVFYYLFQQNNEQAIKQIKFFNKNFPDSSRTEMFKMILPDLEKDGIKYIVDDK